MLDADTSTHSVGISEGDWQACLEKIIDKVELPVRSVLKSSVLMGVHKGALRIGTEGAVWAKDYLNKKAMLELISETLGTSLRIEFVAGEAATTSTAHVEVVQSRSNSSPEVQEDLDLSLNPRYTFATFIRGSSNNLAAAAAMAVAESPARAYNPLFLYGGVGLGKTHLMHAIGHEVMKSKKKPRVVYMSAERFTNEMIDSIGEAKMNRFRRNYRNVDVLLVDDIQFLANKERTQEEFFHTFNELHGNNKQIVLTSDRPPRQIPTLEDRLRSRFEWGMIADVQLPDFETRVAILKKKAEQCKAVVPAEVCNLIAERISSNIRELEGALTRLLATASLQGKPVSMDMCVEALQGILPNYSMQTVDIRKIQDTVCEYFNIPMKELVGARRDQKIVRPRQIAMYLCKEITGSSYPEIAGQFGGKDHTTVMHACRKVDSNLGDHYFKTSLENIQNRLRGINR